MKGVDEHGEAVIVEDGDASEATSVLASLSITELRHIVVTFLKAGGVPILRIAKALRCSESSVLRDARPPSSDVSPDSEE